MTTGRAIILNPTLPDSVKRRQCLVDSLRKSGLEYSEQVEETRIVITWQGTAEAGSPRFPLQETCPAASNQS